jgi:hypothetical protein
MKNKFSLLLIFFTWGFLLPAQNKWEKGLVVQYKTVDKDGQLLNNIRVTRDTLFYEWIDKKKPVKRKFPMNDTLAGKLQTAMKKHKVLKFKSATPKEDSQNIFFTYDLNGKTKQIIFKQPIKPDSKQELFMKEFLEPVLVLVFRQELNGFPR